MARMARATDRPRQFPRSIAEAREFMTARLLNAGAIDNRMLQGIIDKLDVGLPLDRDEVETMQRVTDFGEGIICDCDHRMKAGEAEARAVTFSAV